MSSRGTRIVALVLAAGLSSTAHAMLHDRGAGLIYDDALNVTWLQDANYAKTSGYDADGLMTWQEATAWADQLDIHGYSDWRLPTTLQPDASCGNQTGGGSFGYNCTGSELGHLFYVELGGYVEQGGGAGQSLTTTYISNYGPFSNLDPEPFTLYIYLSDGNVIYSTSNVAPTPDSLLVGSTTGISPKVMWSATESAQHNGDAWTFDLHSGSQDALNKTEVHYAWAVRDGDVAAIPEPETYAMFLSGLVLIGVAARHRT